MNLEFLNVIRAKLYSVQGHWLLYDFLSWRQMSDGRVSWSQKMSDKSRFFMQIFSTWVNVSTRKFRRENPQQLEAILRSLEYLMIGKKSSLLRQTCQNFDQQHQFWNKKRLRIWTLKIVSPLGFQPATFESNNWCWFDYLLQTFSPDTCS